MYLIQNMFPARLGASRKISFGFPKNRIFEKRGTVFWVRALSLLPIAENMEESRFCLKGMFYYTVLLEERVENEGLERKRGLSVLRDVKVFEE